MVDKNNGKKNTEISKIIYNDHHQLFGRARATILAPKRTARVFFALPVVDSGQRNNFRQFHGK